MGEPVIDLVITTYKRPDLLTRTLTHIWERTRAPYRLTVLDDGSDADKVDLLAGWFREGKIDNLVLHKTRVGAMAQLNQGAWMGFSDPIVFSDDDVLCPDVDPDWLARGRDAILARPRMGILALNHPRAHRRVYDYDGEVTYCKFVGGTFMFVRRRFLIDYPLPHFWENYGTTPTTKRCQMANRYGWLVGFLPDVYCQHIGTTSVLTGRQYGGGRGEAECDPVTLEPLEVAYRGPFGVGIHEQPE